MSDIKPVSQLPETTAVSGDDVLPVVSGGQTKKVKVSSLQGSIFPGGVVAFDTVSTMNSHLEYPDGTAGRVDNDPTPANNGDWRKSGASGTGSWVQSSYDRVALVANRVTTLEEPPIDPGLFARPGYYQTDGSYHADTNWGATGLLRVDGLWLGEFSLYGHTAVNSIAFFDVNEAFISGSVAAAIGDYITTFPPIPASAVYVAFSCQALSLNSQQFMSILARPSGSPPDLSRGIFALDAVWYSSSVGYIDTSGQPTDLSDTNWLFSDYLLVTPGTEIVCALMGHTLVNSISFYDKNRFYLSGYNAAADTYPGAIFAQTVTAPAGAAFMRVAFGNPSVYTLNTSYGYGASATYNLDLTSSIGTIVDEAAANASALDLLPYKSRRKMALLATDKVILYGTSISSTDYPWYQEAMTDLTGAVVYNGGFSGYNAAQLASDTCLQRIFDYGARLIVAMIGGNDTGEVGTVGTFSGAVAGEPLVQETDTAIDYNGTYFIQAVSQIMRKVVDYYYNIRARAGLTGTETEAQKEAMIDAVLKPVFIFCTPLPQQRNDASDPFSQPDNWQRKRDAVVECCNKYKVHCVDLFKEVPFDMSLEPYWTSPTDKTTDNGIYYMDGLHPNKWGFQVVSEIVCAELGL